MARWQTLESEAPEIAEKGRALIYQYGTGLGMLATRRANGGLRLHPFCPVVTAGGIYGLIANSPKRADLLERKTYALHAFLPEDRDDEFMLSGAANVVTDAATREAVSAAYHAAGATSSGDEVTFEFDIERALLSLYRPRSEEGPHWPPRYLKWHAPS